MTLSVGTILRVVAVLAWTDGDIAQNVFNVVISGTGGPFDEADVVDDMVDWVEDMYANLASLMSNAIDGSEVKVYEYDAIDDDYDEVGTDSWVYNPTAVGDQLPRGVAGLINARTLDPDVSGKKYVPGLTEVDAAAGLWLGATITALGLFATDWITGFTGATSAADFTPGIWSPTGTVFQAMSGTVSIPTIPAYQRRRKQGVGI